MINQKLKYNEHVVIDLEASKKDSSNDIVVFDIPSKKYGIKKLDDINNKIDAFKSENKEVVSLVTIGAKATSKIALWVAKSTLLMVGEGIKATLEGIREANQEISNSDLYKNRDEVYSSGNTHVTKRDVKVYMNRKKPEMPWWYIPSRDEEEAMRVARHLE